MSYKIQQRGAFFMDAGDATAESILWQYGLWSFQTGGTKLERFFLELVSKELNHFGVIADLFRQIGGHSSRFVLFCSF